MNQLDSKLIEKLQNNNLRKPYTVNETIVTLNIKEIEGDIKIDYSYQRNFVQTEKESSAFVESIFLGLVIPEIQVYEDDETGVQEIIDGQQRTLSLLKYYRNEYPLTDLKLLPQLNGLYYKDLPKVVQNVFKSFSLNLCVSNNPDVNTKFMLFERMNTGSKALNKQEIRKCIYRDSSILKIASNLSANAKVLKVLDAYDNKRLSRDEAILNILSLTYVKTKDSYSMFKRINFLLDSDDNFSSSDVSKMESDFVKVSSFISEYLSSNTVAIIKREKIFMETLYCSLLGFESITELIPFASKVEDAIINVLTDPAYKEACISSVKTTKSSLHRVHLLTKAIKRILSV